mgnify:FL=1
MQTVGRTARHERGMVIMYADKVTDSMRRVIEESERRRALQQEYNVDHGITPRTVRKSREKIIEATAVADLKASRDRKREAKEHAATLSVVEEPMFRYMTDEQKKDLLETMKREMKQAAKELQFERAAELRDEIGRLEPTLGGDAS